LRTPPLSLQKTDGRKFKLIATTILIALPNTFSKEVGQWIVRQLKFSIGIESPYLWQHSEQEKRKKHLARQERLGQVLRGIVPFLRKVKANGMIITGLFDKRPL